MATPGIYPPLYKGPIVNTETLYVGIPVGEGNNVTITIRGETGAAGTVVFELSGFDSVQAPVSQASSAGFWVEDPELDVDIPPIAGAGVSVTTIRDCGGRRARIAINATGSGNIEVYADVKRY